MEILQDHLKPNSSVLDVGAGSGFLSVCFSRFLTAQSESSTGIVGNWFFSCDFKDFFIYILPFNSWN